MVLVERACRPKVPSQQLQGSSTPKPSGEEHLSDSVTVPSVDLNHTAGNSSANITIADTIVESQGKSRPTYFSGPGDTHSERHNIVLVDDIRDPARFTRSDKILSEFNKFVPDVQVKYAYSLARGGVVIHLNSIQDKEKVLKSLPKEAFGGAWVHEPKKDVTVLVKNVPTYVHSDKAKRVLQDIQIGDILVQRQLHSKTGRPLPVLEVKCCPESADKLLKAKEVVIDGHSWLFARQNAAVYRCYNCQEFGHIARACTNRKRCINCSTEHSRDEFCTAPSRCANCQGNHKSSSWACPVYLKQYASLAGKCEKPEYIKRPVRVSSSVTACSSDAASGGVVGKEDFQRLHANIETPQR